MPFSPNGTLSEGKLMAHPVVISKDPEGNTLGLWKGKS
jgi:hypothetical protein